MKVSKDYAREVDGQIVIPNVFYVTNLEKAKAEVLSAGEMSVEHGTDVTRFLGVTFR